MRFEGTLKEVDSSLDECTAIKTVEIVSGMSSAAENSECSVEGRHYSGVHDDRRSTGEDQDSGIRLCAMTKLPRTL